GDRAPMLRHPDRASGAARAGASPTGEAISCAGLRTEADDRAELEPPHAPTATCARAGRRHDGSEPAHVDSHLAEPTARLPSARSKHNRPGQQHRHSGQRTCPGSKHGADIMRQRRHGDLRCAARRRTGALLESLLAGLVAPCRAPLPRAPAVPAPLVAWSSCGAFRIRTDGRVVRLPRHWLARHSGGTGRRWEAKLDIRRNRPGRYVLVREGRVVWRSRGLYPNDGGSIAFGPGRFAFASYRRGVFMTDL